MTSVMSDEEPLTSASFTSASTVDHACVAATPGALTLLGGGCSSLEFEFNAESTAPPGRSQQMPA